MSEKKPGPKRPGNSAKGKSPAVSGGTSRRDQAGFSAPRVFVDGKPVDNHTRGPLKKQEGPKKRLARDSDRDYALQMANLFDRWHQRAHPVAVGFFKKGAFNDPTTIIERYYEALEEGAHLSRLLRQFAIHGTWDIPLEAASLQNRVFRRYADLRRLDGLSDDAAIERCLVEFQCDRRTVVSASKTLRNFYANLVPGTPDYWYYNGGRM